MKIEVGMKFWWVHDYQSANYPDDVGREVTVTKVGYKWAVLNNGARFDINTMLIDSIGYGIVDKLYESQEVYLRELTIKKAWRCFQHKIQYEPPANITIEAIEQANMIIFGIPR